VACPQPAQHGAQSPAVGAKEVFVPDDDDGFVGPGPLDVIALRIDLVLQPKLRGRR
jgi:hypothetical protein